MQTIDAVSLADVKSRKVQWLWQPYIPMGTVTVCIGDGSAGKSWLAMAIAAAVTRGEPLLPGMEKATKPANVILQNAENALDTVVKPRLERLGADCSRVFSLNESEQRLTLTDERIEAAIAHYNARFLICDPLQSYLGAGISMNRADSMRLALTRLEQVAERHKCAILLVGHLNKSGGKAVYRGLGSIDIFNSVPSVLYLGKTSDDERVLVHGKSNLDELGPSLAFRLSKQDGFEWLGECDVTLDELLASKPARSGKQEEAEDFLRDLLAEGGLPATEIEAIAADSGIALRTLNRAKKGLDISTKRVDGHWHWSL